ncbi:hypothetical protein [Haloferula sargassicola]|uniref:Peptidase C-terminal archaeal/bacterial domain-containing protein n=1 Tax=Haloferula sargassicola TaxID=490096 RepID=A0ABP9UN78_9BACT
MPHLSFLFVLIVVATSPAFGISSGETVSGTIATIGEIDELGFTALAGQHIRIGIRSLADNYAVSISGELQAPDGEVVGSVATTSGGLIFHQAESLGTYRIRLSETGDNNTGAWQVQLFLGSGTSTSGDDSGEITNGQDISGSMDVGDIDSWTFSAARGRPVRIGFGEVSADSYFEPRLEVFAPNGELLDTDVDSVGAAIAFTPATTGVYRAILTEQQGSRSNSYRVSLANLDAAVASTSDNGTISNGDELRGTIHYGDFDIWSFQVSAGQAVRFGMGEVNPSSYFYPLVEVFDPSGARVGVKAAEVGASVAFTAGRTGTYTAIVSESGNDVENSYRVFLALGGVVSTADAQTFAIGNGEDRTGLSNYGDFDLATFEVSAGEAVRFGYGEVSPSSYFDPYLEVFDPSGNRVASDLDGVGASVYFTAAQAGVYTAIFAEDGSDVENSYRVSLAIPSRDFEGELGDSLVPNGGDARGSLDYGDFDQWRFLADAGQAVRLGLGEISPNSYFAPALEVYSPSGALIASDVSSVAASVAFTAVESGEYRAVVYESGTDVQNSYRLSLAVAGRDVPASQDSGPLANGVTASGLLHYGDSDLWTFTVEAGKTVCFGFGEIAADSYFEPHLEIFDPSGTRVSDTYGDPGIQTTFVASVSGTYSAIVSEAQRERENSYEVSLVVANSPFETTGRELTAGVALNGGLRNGSIALYAFRANAGDQISLALAEVSADSYFDPRLDVYSSDGNLILSKVGGASVEGGFVAIAGGNYFVLVSEQGANRSGSFTLTADGFTGGPVVFDQSAVPVLFLRPIAGGSMMLSWEAIPNWSLMNSEDLRIWSPGPDPAVSEGINEILIEPDGTEFYRLENK